MITVRYKIFGKVQRVAYRAFVRDKARRLGIFGWVKNLDDGSVECVAHADEQNLDVLEIELKKGPRWAEVDRVEKQELIGTWELNSFEVVS